jgi:hypothetical protein
MLKERGLYLGSETMSLGLEYCLLMLEQEVLLKLLLVLLSLGVITTPYNV